MKIFIKGIVLYSTMFLACVSMDSSNFTNCPQIQLFFILYSLGCILLCYKILDFQDYLKLTGMRSFYQKFIK